MTRFEVKHFEKDEWQEVSEKTAVEKLVDNFDQVTPIISKMLQGYQPQNYKRKIIRFWVKKMAIPASKDVQT